MDYQELRRRLRKLGFEFIRNTRGHDMWGITGTDRTIIIGRHRGEIPPGTLSKILRDLDISRNDLMRG